MSKKLIVYTDGSSYIKDPEERGGYGVLLQCFDDNDNLTHEKELRKGYTDTTIGRMELLAITVALETLKKRDIPITLIIDSQYITNTFNENWIEKWQARKWKKVANVDLWQRFLKIYETYPKDLITWVHIRGHGKEKRPEMQKYIEGNKRADKLCSYDSFDEYEIDSQERYERRMEGH